jgi:hypothetical protein
MASRYRIRRGGTRRNPDVIMKTPNDGGPAFPIATHRVKPIFNSKGDKIGDMTNYLNINHGMSLRDWFAGMALTGYVAYSHPSSTMGTFVEESAAVAYEYADAMLAAREGKEDA